MPTTPRRWFAFRLRTLFVAVAAIGILAAQWPFIEEVTIGETGPDNGQARIVWIEQRLSPRFLAAIGAEAIALAAWLAWRRISRARAQP